MLEAIALGDAWSYQHSDSAMGHLLEMQPALGICPPMLLREGSPTAIGARVIMDFRKASGNGRLGVTTWPQVLPATCGSLCR
jgi:hypothetical protein